jgi:hypothetical protein
VLEITAKAMRLKLRWPNNSIPKLRRIKLRNRTQLSPAVLRRVTAIRTGVVDQSSSDDQIPLRELVEDMVDLKREIKDRLQPPTAIDIDAGFHV